MKEKSKEKICREKGEPGRGMVCAKTQKGGLQAMLLGSKVKYI